jgi:hypothetical protein
MLVNLKLLFYLCSEANHNKDYFRCENIQGGASRLFFFAKFPPAVSDFNCALLRREESFKKYIN